MLPDQYTLPTDSDGVHVQYYEDAPAYAVATEAETGVFRKFTTYLDRLVGPYVQYTKSGTLVAYSHYNFGQIDGDYKEFHEVTDNRGKATRVKKIIGQFRDGVPVGQFQTFYETGNVCTIVNFDNQGHKHGDAFEFYDESPEPKKSALKLQIKYNMGDKDGPVFKYHNNGQIAIRATYSNDLLTGEYIRYSPEGRTRVQCMFVKGQLHGKYLMNYPTGDLMRVLFFNMGRLNGRALFMGRNRKTKCCCTFVLGKLHGSYKSWDDKGAVTTKLYHMGHLVSKSVTEA